MRRISALMGVGLVAALALTGCVPADARVYFKKNEENWGARNLGYVGDDVSFQEGWLRVTITSLESSDKNIEWEVTLTPPSGADYSSFIDTRTFGSFM